MLDLIISYINFTIISLSYIIKKLTFQPPEPPGYILYKNKDQNEIYFIVQNNMDNEAKYEKPNFKNATIEYIQLDKEEKINSELLIIKPNLHFPICIIYCHGNCGDIGYCLYECYLLAKNLNCVVISFEYPHYGNLKNIQFSEIITYKQIQIAHIYANKILNFSEKNIFIYGFSLGTGVAFDLACRNKFPIGGLILQSPYLSIFRVVYNIRKSLFFDIFRNCDKVDKLKAKTLFIHGNKDKVVPYIHGRILAKIIPKQYFYDFYTVNNGNHNNLFSKDSEKLLNKIREFISFCSGINIEKLIKKNIKLDNIKQEYFKNLYKEEKDKNNNNSASKSIIEITSTDETKSQYTIDKTIENNKSNETIITKVLNFNDKRNKNYNLIINRDDSCTDLKNTNFSMINNESTNLKQNTNINNTNEQQIRKLIDNKDYNNLNRINTKIKKYN